MAGILRTPQANDDLIEIWDRIAKDNLSAADRLLRRIDETCKLLSRQPEMGQSQEQYRAGLRSFTVGNYIIFYHPIRDGIEVYRILHGARQWERLL
mgnify:CR=1 FL=1